MSDRLNSADKMAAALQWLLDDLTDAGENKHPDSPEEFDCVISAREALQAYRADKQAVAADGPTAALKDPEDSLFEQAYMQVVELLGDSRRKLAQQLNLTARSGAELQSLKERDLDANLVWNQLHDEADAFVRKLWRELGDPLKQQKAVREKELQQEQERLRQEYIQTSLEQSNACQAKIQELKESLRKANLQIAALQTGDRSEVVQQYNQLARAFHNLKSAVSDHRNERSGEGDAASRNLDQKLYRVAESLNPVGTDVFASPTTLTPGLPWLGNYQSIKSWLQSGTPYRLYRVDLITTGKPLQVFLWAAGEVLQAVCRVVTHPNGTAELAQLGRVSTAADLPWIVVRYIEEHLQLPLHVSPTLRREFGSQENQHNCEVT